MAGVGVGLIGTGFMGKCHALAYAAVGRVFGDVAAPRLVAVCDTPAERAAAMGRQLGFGKAVADWRELVEDPEVEVVSITVPNRLHREMALGAIAAGKHVWCEKPLALTVPEAEEMAEAAARAGVRTLVGYNYLRNPAYRHAQRLVAAGTIGRVVQFRGFVDEDYQADPELAWTWRARLSEAGLGTLGDLGCHLVSLAYGLCGPIESLVADVATVHATRPLADGSGRGTVENEDIASALVRFRGGVSGVLTSSRSAWGRKNRLGFEVHGDRGMIVFEQERMNELKLYVNEGAVGEQGFRTILSGPAHPPYAGFTPAPGHQLGFNDLKVIEAAEFLRSLAGGEKAYPDFSEALEFERVIHAIDRAGRDGGRVAV
ncbi:MAG: Gfo/Idh/MocA family oxidoreductase [Amaricoccus sp.]